MVCRCARLVSRLVNGGSRRLRGELALWGRKLPEEHGRHLLRVEEFGQADRLKSAFRSKTVNGAMQPRKQPDANCGREKPHRNVELWDCDKNAAECLASHRP